MVNYLRNILTSGLAAGIIAFGSGCGDEGDRINNNTYNYFNGKDSNKTVSTDVITEIKVEDLYHQADIQTETIEDLFVAEDNTDLKDASEINADSNVEDTYEVNDTNLLDTYEVNSDTNVEDVFTAEVEDTYEVNTDTNVKDVFTAEVKDTYEVSADTNIEETYEVSADTNVEEVFDVNLNEVEETYIAEIETDTEDTENFDSEVEQISSCENLNEVPACLGDDYATLVSSGWEVNTALDLKYVGVTTDQNVDNPKKVVSGNPCTLLGYFTGETCLDWIDIEKQGIATIKLIDEENVEIRGGLAERIIALNELANGNVQGTECVVNIENDTINCNEQPEE